jgi:DNA recombination protein RmuC
VDEIADKYIRPDEGTYDFALMYIPAESVYAAAVEHGATSDDGPAVLTHALARRVIPVSPHTFYAYLLVIVHGLQGLHVAERTREIQGDLDALRRQFEAFWAAYEKVGGHLANAQKQYAESERQGDRVRDRFGRLTEAGVPAPPVGDGPPEG